MTVAGPHGWSGLRPAQRSEQSGFTLLELAIVIFIMALMFTVAMPYMGAYRKAKLKSEARRLAGRASFLFEEAAAQKVLLRLVFDLDRQAYGVLRLDPMTPAPEFIPDNGTGGKPVQLPDSVSIRDVTVADLGSFTEGRIGCQFYPSGYVDATLIHLVDLSGHVMSLAINPATGRVIIVEGDVGLDAMLTE